MRARARPWLATILGIACSWSAAARADATDNDAKIAEALFDEGRVLLDQKRYPEACAKLAESQRLDPGGGTLLNLALCHELEGRTATAWTEFKEALGQAAKDERDDRARFAREHLQGIEPRLVRILVVVPPRLSGRAPEIVLDDSRLAGAAWGTPIPVDPGDHRVALRAHGVSPWETRIDARDEGRTYRIDVPELVPAAPPPRVEQERVRSRTFWFVLAGAGFALAGGIATGVVALREDAYVTDNCVSERSFCKVDDAGDAATRARTFAWISTGAVAVAAAATFVAFVLPLETRTKIAASVRAEGGAALATLRITAF